MMKRQLLELWEEKWKHDTYTITMSNSISSQKEKKEKKRVSMIKDNEIFSDPGTFV